MDLAQIAHFLRLVGAELAKDNLTGEIVLAGGAVMLLVIQSRETTKGIDAYFATNSEQIRDAAKVVAKREGLPDDWLNDAFKGFIFTSPLTTMWLECPGLRVFYADPDYVLAPRAVAGRPQDIEDIQAPAAFLHLHDAHDILSIVTKYIPEQHLRPATRYLT